MAEKKKYERVYHDETDFERRMTVDLELTQGKLIHVWKATHETYEAQEAADYSLAHWLAYLTHIGEGWRSEIWAKRAREGQVSISLPRILPDEFDIKYRLPDRLPGVRFSDLWRERRSGKHANEQTLEERRETVESALREVRKAAKNMQMFPDEPRRHPFDNPAEKPKTLDDLKREAQENPVKMSSTLAAKLGIKDASNE